MSGNKKRKLSIHQLPSSEGYLRCWVARPGWVWIHSDFRSLESVVLAELSEDRALMQLFGPEAKPNQDVFLFNGCHYPGFADKIRPYYDPDNPPATAEDLARIKHQLATVRKSCKRITHGFSYGMGAKTLATNLRLDGLDISDQECWRITQAHRQLYSGAVEYGNQLLQEWQDRGGWVYDGLGCPVAVSPMKTKDLVSRVIQRTGHSILWLWVVHIEDTARERHVPLEPVIVDFHDASFWATPERYQSQGVDVVREAYRRLNEELQGIIPISGSVDVGKCLYEFKD